ncbi:glycosyltransferase [Phocaeicola sp.]
MKKVLLITSGNPFAPFSGENQRTNLLLSALLQYYTVDIVCFTDDEYPHEILQHCNIVYWGSKSQIKHTRLKKIKYFFKHSLDSYYWVDKRYKSAVDSILKSNHYEFIMVRYIRNVCFCGLETSSNIIVDVDDLPEEVLASSTYVGTLRNIYYSHLLKKINVSTTKFLSRIKHSFFSNPNQCTYPHSSYLPNIPYIQKGIVDDIPFSSRKNIILFVGFLAYYPNYSGLNYFITNIWENVLKRIPDAELRIVGKGLPEEYLDSWKKYSGISILGYVQDLMEEYKKCKVAIVPIYAGGGSNIKVLEAMSLKRPCVVSKFATRGFEEFLKDGHNIYIAEDAEDFAGKIANLLNSSDMNSLITENAYDVIKQHYSFQAFSDYLMKGINDSL